MNYRQEYNESTCITREGWRRYQDHFPRYPQFQEPFNDFRSGTRNLPPSSSNSRRVSSVFRRRDNLDTAVASFSPLRYFSRARRAAGLLNADTRSHITNDEVDYRGRIEMRWKNTRCVAHEM